MGEKISFPASAFISFYETAVGHKKSLPHKTGGGNMDMLPLKREKTYFQEVILQYVVVHGRK